MRRGSFKFTDITNEESKAEEDKETNYKQCFILECPELGSSRKRRNRQDKEGRDNIPEYAKAD